MSTFQTPMSSFATYQPCELSEIPKWIAERIKSSNSGHVANTFEEDCKSSKDFFVKLIAGLNTPEMLGEMGSLDRVKKEEMEDYIGHCLNHVLQQMSLADTQALYFQLVSCIQPSNIYMIDLFVRKQPSIEHKINLLSAIWKYALRLQESMQRVYDDVVYHELEQLMEGSEASKSDPYWWFTDYVDEFLILLVDSMFKKPRELTFKWKVVDLLMKRDFNQYSHDNLLRLLIVYVTFASSRENLLRHISLENFVFCQNKCKKVLGPDYLNCIARREEPSTEDEASFDLAMAKKDPNFNSNAVLLLCSQSLITEVTLDFGEIFKYLPTMYKVFIKFKAIHPIFVSKVNRESVARENLDDFDNRMITIMLYNSFKFPEIGPKINQVELYKMLIKNKHKLSQLNSHQVLYILFSLRNYIYAMDRGNKDLRMDVDLKIDPTSKEIIRTMLMVCIEIFVQKFPFWTFNSCSMILNETVIKFKSIDRKVWEEMKMSSQLVTMMIKEQNELHLVDLFNFATVYKTFIRRVDRTTVDDWGKIFKLLEMKIVSMTSAESRTFKLRLPKLLLGIDDVLNKSMSQSDPKYIEELRSVFKKFQQKHLKNNL